MRVRVRRVSRMWVSAEKGLKDKGRCLKDEG